MRRRFFFGGGTALLGLVTVLVPICIFPTCKAMVETVSGGRLPMKCFWSGRAEIGIGILILFGGVLLICLRSAQARAGVGLMTALAGILGIAVPAFLIGGCALEAMTCRISTFPAIYVLCALVLLLQAPHLFYLKKQVKPDES